jgi:mannose-6-phosphate isomerase-like protein (cupin superfamily)
MSGKLLVIRNKEEVEGEQAYHGVTRRILLDKRETASKKLTVVSLEIHPWCSCGPIEQESEILYYVLSGRGNLDYAPGHFHKKPVPLSVKLFDWDTDSYAYVSPGRSHGMLNQGESSLIVLKVEYDSPRDTGSFTPWGVSIFKRDLPVRTDKTNHGLSIVNQIPSTFQSMGARNFQAMEYEIILKPENRSLKKASASIEDRQLTKPTSETVNYVVRGEGKYLIDDKEYKVRAGSVVYSSCVNAALVDVGELTLDYLMFNLRM